MGLCHSADTQETGVPPSSRFGRCCVKHFPLISVILKHETPTMKKTHLTWFFPKLLDDGIPPLFGGLFRVCVCFDVLFCFLGFFVFLHLTHICLTISTNQFLKSLPDNKSFAFIISHSPHNFMQIHP